ncbi:MAG TPA: hypothetical protein VNO81_06135 [Candidatus Nitrosotenuis sp.]|nr:hypothetical protein [Candidatus Nitrosotenuis sp.]
MQKPVGLIAASILLGLLGQYLFKAGMSQPAYKALVTEVGVYARALARGELAFCLPIVLDVLRLLFKPLILAGLCSYGSATVLWLAVLSKTELSFAYPLLSVGYVVILLMGWLAFKENVTLLRCFGVLLISLGIIAIYSEEFFLSAHRGFALVLLLLALAVFFSPYLPHTTPATQTRPPAKTSAPEQSGTLKNSVSERAPADRATVPVI